MRTWIPLVVALLALTPLPAMEAAGPTLSEGLDLPAFELPSAGGENVTLAGLTADGPAVLVIYRGVW